MTRFDDVLADRDGTFEYDKRIFEIGSSGQHGSTGTEIQIDADVVGVASSRRRHASGAYRRARHAMRKRSAMRTCLPRSPGRSP